MRQRGIICLFLLLLFAIACSHEDYVRDYPQLVSIEMKSNTASGVEVEATMAGVLTDQVINHGFVWSLTLTDLVLPSPYGSGIANRSYALRLGKPAGKTFSTTVKSQLINKKKYFLRAFIQTNKTIVYGEPITFTSLGSDGAVITRVSPTPIAPGSVITISGERFGTDATQVKVWIKTTYPRDSIVLTVQTIKDTEITALVPKTGIFYNGKIGVSRIGDQTYAYLGPVEGRGPTITSIIATDICSSFKLKGRNLLVPGQPRNMVVNGRYFDPLPAMTDSTITIPASMHASVLSVSLSYSNFDFDARVNDPVPMPTVTSMPALFLSDNTFVVQGSGFAECGLQISAQPYDVVLSISNVTPTQFTVTVSNNICTEFYPLVMFGNRRIYLPMTSVKPPKRFDITSISPLAGTVGDHITVNGTGLDNVLLFMDGNFNKRLLQTTIQTATQIDAVIVAPLDYRVDINPDGNVDLLFEGCGVQQRVTYNLSVPTITITGVSPAVSDGTQEIVITGTNFLSDVDLAFIVLTTTGFPAFPAPYEIKSKTNTTITFYPPGNYSSTTGTMYLSASSFGRIITSGTFEVHN